MMKKMLKPTILSLSTLTIMAGAAVSPALAEIATAFPDASPTQIKMILTLPAVFIILFALLSGRLSAYLSKRVLLSVGLLIYLLAGVGGGLVNQIDLMLVSRALLGVGVGLVMPLSTGLIADFYAGEERSRMMGYSAAASNLGGIVATLAAGILASFSWRYSFGIYASSLVVLVLVLMFLPEPEAASNQKTKQKKLPFVIYGWAALAFLLMVAFFSVPVSLALYIEQNDMGGASSAGLAMSVMTACGFVAGLTFARVQRACGKCFVTLLLIFMALGFSLLSQATGYSQILLAVGLIGLSLGWSMPVIFVGATRAGGQGSGVPIMAVVSSLVFFGQFMSPIVLDGLGRVFGDTSSRFTFTLLATSYCILILVALGRCLWPYLRPRSENDR